MNHAADTIPRKPIIGLPPGLHSLRAGCAGGRSAANQFAASAYGFDRGYAYVHCGSTARYPAQASAGWRSYAYGSNGNAARYPAQTRGGWRSFALGPGGNALPFFQCNAFSAARNAQPHTCAFRTTSLPHGFPCSSVSFTQFGSFHPAAHRTGNSCFRHRRQRAIHVRLRRTLFL